MASSDVAVQPAPTVSDFGIPRKSSQNIGLLELGPPDRWSVMTGGALGCLVLLWAWQVHSTWAAWGNLTIDSGHEMDIPALLAEGKMLYRDLYVAR